MIDLKTSNKIPGALLQDIKEYGCAVLPALLAQESPKAQTLIITDNPDTVLYAKAAGAACIAYEDPLRPLVFANTDLIIQDLDCLTLTLLIRTCQRHYHIPWRIAQTKRLSIRESAFQDFDALYAIYQTPGICDYIPGMTGEREAERASFLSYIRTMYPFYGYGLWTVTERLSGRVIGRVGLQNGSFRGKPVLEAGYLIGDAWQNRGYATEAMQGVLEYAVRELEEERIYAFINPQNRPSMAVAKKLHMERIEENCWRYDGRKSMGLNTPPSTGIY